HVGATADIIGVSLTHNRAVGGVGNAAVGGFANLGAGGGIYVGLGNFELDTGFVLAPSVVNISDSILEHNQARGGQDAAGNGADGWGGAIASLFAATTNVTGSTLANNHAIGDDGSSGGQGGNGFGGGRVHGTP